jgi:hypothetical protein
MIVHELIEHLSDLSRDKLGETEVFFEDSTGRKMPVTDLVRDTLADGTMHTVLVETMEA